MASHKQPPPQHILILGSGVFGLGTLSTFLSRPLYANTRFTVVSPSLQQPHTASWDSTRIIRADYSDPSYSALAVAAQEQWRQSPWKEDYAESGLLLSEVPERGAAGTANGYVAKALATASTTVPAEALQALHSRQELSEAMRVDGRVRNPGTVGYINRSSGWADAASALAKLGRRLAQDARVTFVDGKAEYLLVDAASVVPSSSSSSPLSSDRSNTKTKQKIAGAYITNHGAIHADLTIVATGAWTPALIDTRGIASCTAQCMLYISLSESEAQRLSALPVVIDFNEGRFFFPPTTRTAPDGSRIYEIKAARHAYGYTNPVRINHSRVLGAAAQDTHKVYEPSLPCDGGTPIPTPDASALLSFLDKALPLLNLRSTAAKRNVSTRICHYFDTQTGDFIVSPHPAYDAASLFVMTGGSGHAYKFLPKMGDVAVDVYERTVGVDDHAARGLDIDVWRSKWAWPARTAEDDVWCDDGSRGGFRGVLLRSALAGKAGGSEHRSGKL